MSDDDIDLDRVVADPDYRRRVIEFLSIAARIESDEEAGHIAASPVERPDR